MAKKKLLKKLLSGKVDIFKLKNRRGFAAIWSGHLTEGKSPVQAFQRMAKAVKRSGYELLGKVRKAR